MFLKSKATAPLKTQISTPIGKSTINSPKRVIKALYDYQGKSPNELSFKQGDFFLVTGRENDLYYYEAFNSITKSRGIVPVSYFAIVEKPAVTTPVVNKSAVVYGVVLYDFQAERSDELTAKAGEPILITAQSNAEWYVAKPIGRLGGPGLIPISFVDIRDATMTGSTDSYFPDVPHVVSAYIDTFILEGEQYWFIVFAKLSNGKYRVLYRLYEDFHDFQVLFLHKYPKEAGQYNSEERRILPYMPGPVKLVTEEITADRARDLTRYCKELLELPDYLSKSSLVQDQLFGIHEGDIETNMNPNSKEKTIKVKIIYKDDIVAIKIPVSSSFEFLKGKIVNRLGFDVYLQYKSGDRLVELSRELFQQAVKLGKLTVVATYK